MKKIDSIICDVSGTHTRVAYVDNKEIFSIRDYDTKDIKSTKDLISMYMYLEKIETKKIVCSAAGRVNNTKSSIQLHNSTLLINEYEFKEIGFENITLLNDFEAIANGVKDVSKVQVFGNFQNENNYLVIGAGTGLGVCEYKENITLNKEEGHTSINEIQAQLTPREFDCMVKIQENLGKESLEFEEILSGRGLERIYHYVAGSKLTAQEISLFDTVSSQETFNLFYSFYLKSILYFLEKHEQTQVVIAGGIIMKNMHKFSKEIKQQWIQKLQENNSCAKIILDYDISLYGLRNMSVGN